MSAEHHSIEKLFAEMPEAIWSPADPFPVVYRGTPIEMVRQMALEMGPDVTPTQAIDTLSKALAKTGRLRLQITGNPPEPILAGIFVHVLLEHGICRPMAQA